MSYPGSKAGAGVYQAIINQIPPHDVYIEGFGGSAALYRKKRKALRNKLIEIDTEVFSKLEAEFRFESGVYVMCADFIEWATHEMPSLNTFIYLDPPYLGSTRSNRRYYLHEFRTEPQHRRLLEICLFLSEWKSKPFIMISGYDSDLYRECMKDWRVVSFQAMTRGGPRTEYLWMNYEEPERLHEYTYLGQNYRERERIKRKAKRWVEGLARLPVLERRAILGELEQRYF